MSCRSTRAPSSHSLLIVQSNTITCTSDPTVDEAAADESLNWPQRCCCSRCGDASQPTQ
jgi:hypothetical protein